MSYPTRPYKIACSKNTAGLGLSAHRVHINSLTSPHMTPAKLSVTSHTHSAGSLRGSRVTPKHLCWPPLPCAHCRPNPPTHLQSQCHGAPASTISALTLLPHARLLALAQPALLTLATHVHVHFTLATVLADVLCTLDDTASEEALAAFTAQHVVVEARGLVPTHAAHFVSQHLRGRALLPLQGGIFYRNEQYQGKGRWGGGETNKKENPHIWGKHGVCSWLPHSLQQHIFTQTHCLPNIWMKRSSIPFHRLPFWASIFLQTNYWHNPNSYSTTI